MDKKNEFSHSSIDCISIAKTEKRKISLEEVLFAAVVLALSGVAYCNHANNENAKATDYSFKVSTGTFNPTFYLREYKK